MPGSELMPCPLFLTTHPALPSIDISGAFVRVNKCSSHVVSITMLHTVSHCLVAVGICEAYTLTAYAVVEACETLSMCSSSWWIVGVFAAPAVQGLPAEVPAPAVAVTSVAAAAAATAVSSAPVAASAAASAATSAEAARVKELEAKLAEFQAQSSLLQAQNMRLASELGKAQQLSQEGARMALLVQPPSNWQAHAQGQTLLYIELPISDGVKQQGKRFSDVELKAHHKGWFYDMSTNEVNMNDALAALRSAIPCNA